MMTEIMGGRLVPSKPSETISEPEKLPKKLRAAGPPASALAYGSSASSTREASPGKAEKGKGFAFVGASAFSFLGLAPKVREREPLDAQTPKRQVKLPEIAGAPFKAICHLAIEYQGNQTGNGSGFFVGPRTILTAGHCVYLPKVGQATRITVVPARQGEAAPFGWDEATEVDFSTEWRQTNPDAPQPGHDYGVVFLPTPRLHQRVGHALKWAAFSDTDIKDIRVVNVAGFPDYKDEAFVMECVVDDAHPIEQRVLYHKLETHEGQSGGPIMHYNTGTAVLTAFGIHTYGHVTANVARRIDKDLSNIIQRWVTDPRPFMAGAAVA
jgi:V8-like Glu-specific endopeptidase